MKINENEGTFFSLQGISTFFDRTIFFYSDTEIKYTELEYALFFVPTAKSAVSIFGSYGKVYELETDHEGFFILTVPSTGNCVVNIPGYKNELFLSFKFNVFKSVHHRTIQINHQPDATIFQFINLTFIYN